MGREFVFLELCKMGIMPNTGSIRLFQFNILIRVDQVLQQDSIVLLPLAHHVVLDTNVALVSHVGKVSVVHHDMTGVEVNLVADVGEIPRILGEYVGHGLLKPVPGHGTLPFQDIVRVILIQRSLGLGGEQVKFIVPVAFAVVAWCCLAWPCQPRPLGRGLHGLGHGRARRPGPVSAMTGAIIQPPNQAKAILRR